MDYRTMSNTDLIAAVPSLSNEALTAALAVKKEQRDEIINAAAPTPAQVDEAEAHVASITAITTEQKARSDAAKRLEALRASVNDGVEDGAEGDEEGGDADEDDADNPDDGSDDADEDDADDESEGDETVEAASAPPFEKKSKKDDEEGDGSGDSEDDPKKKAVNTASAKAPARRSGKSTAAKVAAANARPNREASKSPVTITAAADVPKFAAGSEMKNGMTDLTQALISRAKGFAPFSLSAAKRASEASGGEPILSKFGLATFDLPADEAITASSSADDYNAVSEARKRHLEYLQASMAGGDVSRETMVANGWCAPSEIVYSWVADYVVDGLKSVPSVSAPRGGLMTTTGPALADEYEMHGRDFGFTQTEAEAVARKVKTCETIICPDFEDHRLDAIGYCWKIPILTQKAYPELITDALRLSDALFAHKMNTRRLDEISRLSDPFSAVGAMGGSVDDTLEALSAIAVHERRHFNVGVNAVMEVTLPQFALEVFRMDMTRRAGRPLSEVATDNLIRAEFAARKLAVEYVADLQDLEGGRQAVFPGSFTAIMYPAGTFVEATEDVINLQAVYDAASLSINEYTGVFFEQGHMLFKNAYRSSKVEVPVCTAGVKGANVLECVGNGSI